MMSSDGINAGNIGGGGRFSLMAPDPPPPLLLDTVVGDGSSSSSSSSSNDTEFVVVGAGPSGLLTACLLKSRNISADVKVFDGRERPTSFFGSFPVVLNRRGLAAIQAFDDEQNDINDENDENCPSLLQKVHNLGRKVNQMHILTGKPDEAILAKTDTYGICIMRDQLVGLLLEQADRLQIPLYWKHKLMKVDLDNRAAIFELENNSSSSSSACGCDESAIVSVKATRTLVGADGNYSRVRRDCEAERLVTVNTWHWGVKMRYLLTPNPTTDSNNNGTSIDGRNHYVLGSNGYVCQQPDGVWSMSYSIPIVDGEDGVDEDHQFLLSNDPTTANIAKLKALTQQMSPTFANHLLTNNNTAESGCDGDNGKNEAECYASFFRHKVFGGYIVKCSTLAPTDWIALIGDAAHAVAPFTGEGINSALESGKLLAQILCDHNGNCDGDCSEYDRVRRADAHALCRFALRNRKLVSGTPVQKCVHTFGTIVLGLLKKYCCIQSVMEDLMLGAKAKNLPEPVPYSELMRMDETQRFVLNGIGWCCFYTVCCTCCGKCK